MFARKLMDEMTTRRALALAVVALNAVVDRYPGEVEWRQAREVVCELLEDARKAEEQGGSQDGSMADDSAGGRG